MRIACRIPKSTDTRSEYVTLILFPLQQRLHESTVMLRYTHIAGLVRFSSISRPSNNKRFRNLSNLTVRWCEHIYRLPLFVYLNCVVFSLCWFCDWSVTKNYVFALYSHTLPPFGAIHHPTIIADYKFHSPDVSASLATSPAAPPYCVSIPP